MCAEDQDNWDDYVKQVLVLYFDSREQNLA